MRGFQFTMFWRFTFAWTPKGFLLAIGDQDFCVVEPEKKMERIRDERMRFVHRGGERTNDKAQEMRLR